MRYFCGIDVGASATKLVVIDETGGMVARAVRRSGIDYAATAGACLDEALGAARIDRTAVARFISTGYGRDNVPFSNATMTEIACHGRGAYYHFKRAMTVIDIGGQDNKVIHLNALGRRTGFK